MKYRPSDNELLDVIAELLEDRVMEEVGPELRHQVRVAANLLRILQRQTETEALAEDRERSVLATFLNLSGDLGFLRSRLVEEIRGASTGDPRLWAMLVETARDDLAVAKPGYSDWEGQ